MKIFVKTHAAGKTVTLDDVTSAHSVEDIKAMLTMSPDERLVFAGECLDDSRAISSYGIQNESTLHVLSTTPGVCIGLCVCVCVCVCVQAWKCVFLSVFCRVCLRAVWHCLEVFSPPPRPATGGRLFVKTATGKTITLRGVNLGLALLHIKEAIEEAEGTPVDDQRLSFAGVGLYDRTSCEQYGIQDGDTLHLQAQGQKG
jgi:ubiquitin-large subunit ribosomal protein L40e